ncbi:UDP-glucose 4-epimerase GalE (plasmid) [Bacillus thuringiensis serovar coreanensis]|nr:UDP-glucose 4-epimerase GalE [Bacillus thuringiensis serovar coreanensis]MED1305214.1 UDP-glucose 4-epimerase GalE [Bacillus pacificus]
MSIGVIGGAGYIGSHAVYQLLNQGEKVIVIDNLQTGHEEAVHPQANLYKGDIRDRDFLNKVFKKEKITQIIHFGASSLVGESMENPLKYYDNNVYGTQVLLEVMHHHNINQIVFSSSAATYGEQQIIPITETAQTEPTSTYGETKLVMEKMMKWCDQAYGIKYVSLRYFNVAGARSSGEIGEAHTPETHLIPVVLEVANGKREHINIFGEDYNTPDGTCIRDYIHVEDLVEAHILALKYLKENNESNIFNLGSNQGFSVKEIIVSARKVTGHPIPTVIGNRRDGDPAILIASSQKAKEVLGWRPSRTEIERIISDAWEWHKSHPQGYEKIKE